MGTSETQVLKFISDSPSRVNYASLKHHFCELNPKRTKAPKKTIAKFIQAAKLGYAAHLVIPLTICPMII